MTVRRVVLYATTGTALTYIALAAVVLRAAVAADIIHSSRDTNWPGPLR